MKIKILLVFLFTYNHLIMANGIMESDVMSDDNNILEVVINKTFEYSKEIRPFDSLKERRIQSLDLTGHIFRKKAGYLVRIILLDDNNKEYLILESYDEINDSDTINIERYCQETISLNKIKPLAIKVFINNAFLKIDKLNLAFEDNKYKTNKKAESVDSIRYKQVLNTVKSINDYNKKHNKLWWAEVTPLSLKKYEEKKRVLGMSDNASTGGIEYYGGGIFEVGEKEASLPVQTNSSSYVDSFDWRNRHGRNWMTPSKSQEGSGYCVAFAVVSVAEALVNLYYNDSIDLDLSEQEVACCASRPNPYTYKYGMGISTGLNYMKIHGTCDEYSYPFVDDSLAVCMSGEISPKQLVKIGGYKFIGGSATDDIKKALIKNGPLVSGIVCKGINHAMTLVGYETIHAGDSLEQIIKYTSNPDSYVLIGQSIIPENDPRIGMTCWIFKDNYPDARAPRNGYMYVLFHNPNNMNSTYSENYPFEIMNYTDDDIICEDKDGDGFYFWGLGPKPNSCPSWVPDIPDGDDSNPLLGMMDDYGFMENLNPDERDTVFVVDNKEVKSNYNIYNHIVVKRPAVLEITESLTFYNGSSLILKNGSTLYVRNKAFLNKARIKMESGSRIIVCEEGSIIPLDSEDFFVPKGATLELINGSIKK